MGYSFTILVFTLQQNGKTERKNHHIIELGFTLLAQAFMPLS